MLENPERSGTERNGTESNVAQYRRGHRICYRKSGLSMYRELISRSVPATKTGQAPSRQYRATSRIWNILAVYLGICESCCLCYRVFEKKKVLLSKEGVSRGSMTRLNSVVDRTEPCCIAISLPILNDCDRCFPSLTLLVMLLYQFWISLQHFPFSYTCIE